MALPELTDAELAKSRKLLLRFAHIQLPDRPDLAEDLVQETMLSAYRAAEGFKGGAQVSSWLFAILKTKLPTACAKSDGNAKFSSRATRKPWMKLLKDILPPTGIGRMKDSLRVGTRPKPV